MNTKQRLLNLVHALVLVAAAAGCATYGGWPVMVKLSSTPAGATCYVLPATEWIRLGNEKLLADRAELAKYAVPGKVTPCEVELPMIRTVFVAEHGGLAAWTLFTPSTGGSADVTIIAPAPEAAVSQ